MDDQHRQPPADPDGPGPEPPRSPPPSAHADVRNERAMDEPPIAPDDADDAPPPPG
jgi:hypothetical protein